MDESICPYCGAKNDDMWELSLKDGESTEVECGVCEHTYVVECLILVEYDSTEISAQREHYNKHGNGWEDESEERTE